MKVLSLAFFGASVAVVDVDAGLCARLCDSCVILLFCLYFCGWYVLVCMLAFFVDGLLHVASLVIALLFFAACSFDFVELFELEVVSCVYKLRFE